MTPARVLAALLAVGFALSACAPKAPVQTPECDIRGAGAPDVAASDQESVLEL